MERRWYASAFGSEPQWAEVVKTAHELEKSGMLEKADAAEMLGKADAEMADKADMVVEKGDTPETLASNLEAQCIPLAIERWSSWLLPAHINPLHP
jgi:hypothetical protein